jgi:hypothetical protein
MLEGQHLFGLKTLQRRLSERGKQKARTVASSGFLLLATSSQWRLLFARRHVHATTRRRLYRHADARRTDKPPAAMPMPLNIRPTACSTRS